MKKLLIVAVLVSAFSQMAQGYEPGPVMPANRNIGGNGGRQIIKTGGGVQQNPNLAAKLRCMRAGNNWNPFTNTCSMATGGGVQKLRPGQNGGGQQIINTKGGIQNLESRRKALRDLCFRHDKAYIVRKGQVGRCLPSGKSVKARLNMNSNIRPVMPVTSTASRNGRMTGNRAGGSF